MTDSPKRKLSEHLRQRTKEWFRKADHELAYLELSPFDAEDPPTDTAGKMSHMVAEYSLKAYLMLNKKPIEKSHDLIELLDDCLAIHNDNKFDELRSDCQLLTQYRLDLVYPTSTSETITVEEAKAAIEKARRIRDFVMAKAEELGYSHD
ncbi:MAG: HEPN domain-containing protein [Chloroflexota bacterium]